MKCTCKLCKRQFLTKKKLYTCPNCKLIDEAYFSRIEAYLKEYPNSSAVQISETLGISAEIIVGYMCEGRLSYSQGFFEKLK